MEEVKKEEGKLEIQDNSMTQRTFSYHVDARGAARSLDLSFTLRSDIPEELESYALVLAKALEEVNQAALNVRSKLA